MYIPTSILENDFVLLVKIIFFALCTALVFGLSFLAVWALKSAFNFQSKNNLAGRISAFFCSISLIVGIISGVSLIWIKPKTNLIPVPLVILLASLPIVCISWFFADHYDFKLD